MLSRDHELARVSDAAFRLYITLKLLADDVGRMALHPFQLVASTWWGQRGEADVHPLLDELARGGIIVRYQDAKGQEYAEIIGWTTEDHPRFERPDKPKPSAIPGPGDAPPQGSFSFVRERSRPLSTLPETPLDSPREESRAVPGIGSEGIGSERIGSRAREDAGPAPVGGPPGSRGGEPRSFAELGAAIIANARRGGAS